LTLILSITLEDTGGIPQHISVAHRLDTRGIATRANRGQDTAERGEEVITRPPRVANTNVGLKSDRAGTNNFLQTLQGERRRAHTFPGGIIPQTSTLRRRRGWRRGRVA
jgi:hypothetical protein